jgi:uncharacterized protein involved in copper resistance
MFKKLKNNSMKSIFSKAVITAIIASVFAINVQAATAHNMAADTGKMNKMDKMDHKMGKKKMDKMKKGKMKKDTSKM